MTQTVLLGDIAEKITKGTTPTTYGANFTNTGVNFVKVESITEYGSFLSDKFVHVDTNTHNNLLKRSIIEEGDILLTMAGAIGRIAQVPRSILPANTNQAVSIIRVNAENVDRRYIRYFLESPNAKRQFLGGITQSAQPNLSLGNISKIQIPLPDLKTQKKIADILGTIDEKIELNRQMNGTLEQMGQALFHYYFIDNPEAGKWEKGKFADVADVLTGKGSTRSQLSENGIIPLYGANGIMGTSEDYLYDEPVVITGRVGTLGKVRAVTGQAWFSDNVLIIRPKVASFGYIYNLAQTFDYISMNRGSTQPLITQTDLRNRPVRIPATKTLERFEAQFSLLFSQQQNNKDEIQTLTTLRNTLLPRLINGKVKV